MYYLYGYRSIYSKIQFLLGENNNLALSDPILSKAYAIFLKRYSVLTDLPKNQNITIIDYKNLEPYVSPLYYFDRKKHFTSNSILLEERIAKGFFIEALQTLKTIDSKLYELSLFFIKVIIVNHMSSYTNGTTDDTLGLSIMNFKDEFTQQDFIELVIHQLTHMMLFFSDHINPQYLSENKNFMIPTTLKFILGGNKFPAHLAFHSFVVAIEILLFRHHTDTLNFNGPYHGSTQRIQKIIQQFFTALDSHAFLFTDEGQKIIYDAMDSISFL